MRRSVGLGLLMTLACPLVLAGQGVPAADSLAKAASAASAANTVAINFVWTLVAGFLVMFMQAGFAMVETGFTRAKNAAHTITMNFMVYGIAMLAYWAVGFALPAGGWLAMLGKNLGLGHGHVDFAGSSVVHMTGGVMAFVTAALLGPRRGKYNADGSVNAIPGHNIPMALIGTFILAFGWFGFNAGSTLAGSDLRIGVIATNTMLAGAVRGLFYGDASQFVAQLVGGAANIVGVGAMAFVAYKVTAFVVNGHRVAPEVEELGLDLPEMGALAYPDTHEIGSAVILRETASTGGIGQLQPEPEAV